MRRIGGTDIPKLLGLSKYGNEANVYSRIVDGIDDEWSPVMERGIVMEPVLRAHGQRALGLELEDRDDDYHPHPVYEFATAQIDDLARYQGYPVVVDYKSKNRFMKGFGAQNSDEIPEDIRAQMAWEMFCADRDLGLLVVGFGEDMPLPDVFNLSHVVTYQIQRDERFEALCVATAKDFWERHIEPRIPPSVKPITAKKRKTK